LKEILCIEHAEAELEVTDDVIIDLPDQEEKMKIKEVSAGVKVSKNYNSYSVNLVADVENNLVADVEDNESYEKVREMVLIRFIKMVENNKQKSHEKSGK